MIIPSHIQAEQEATPPQKKNCDFSACLFDYFFVDW